MRRLLISSGLLLATSCGGDAGTGEMVSDETAGADTALPDSETTEPNSIAAPSSAPSAGMPSSAPSAGNPSAPTNPDPGTLPESEGNTTPTEPVPDIMQNEPSPIEPVPDIMQNEPSPIEPVPDIVQNEPSPTDPMPDTNEPEPNMMEETDADSGTDAETPVSLSFATDIWPVWSAVRDPVFVYRGMGSYAGCADVGVCHGGENPGAGLSMVDQETAYAQMMDTPSVSGLCAGTQRVAVGDPDNSCLILFYEGRLGEQDLDWVDNAEIELMREWIRQGALP